MSRKQQTILTGIAFLIVACVCFAVAVHHVATTAGPWTDCVQWMGGATLMTAVASLTGGVAVFLFCEAHGK